MEEKKVLRLSDSFVNNNIAGCMELEAEAEELRRKLNEVTGK